MSTNRIHEDDLLKTLLLKDILSFTRYFFKQRFNRKFVVGDHHKKIAEELNNVFNGTTKKLIINIAPRYGKTELAVKNFIAMGMALNPKSKFIHVSYSDGLVADNSAEIQSIITEPEYERLFGVTLTSSNKRMWYNDKGGGLYSVSSSGQVTGFGAGLVDKTEEEINKELDEFISCISNSERFGGAIVVDDPIKPEDALSDLIREKVNRKFETTIRSRVNSRNTPIVIIMQRVHEHDLCGYLQEIEPDEWKVLSLPCIYTDEDGNEKALWEHKHTIEELRRLQETNSFVFETQYLQNPMPFEGLMYEQEFKEYEIKPKTTYTKRKAYVDTADTGADYLCAIIYDETDIGNFIVDVLYTQKPMEYTETALSEKLTMHRVEIAHIESNAGGRSFCRAVEKQCRMMKNNITRFIPFSQNQNKNVRIFTRSAEVQNLTYFPKGWKRIFTEFAVAITHYRKEGGNAHDDAPDALTGTVEKIGSIITTDKSIYF